MTQSRNGGGPRSVALAGPFGAGKSTLFDALMDAAGAPVKRPADARNRPSTTEIRLGHCAYLGDSWAILDCPGSVEFAHETAAALAVADIAVVVVEPVPDHVRAVSPLLKALAEAGTPHMVFVNKADRLEGRLAETLEALQAHSRAPLVLRQIPIQDGDAVGGYVDLMSERAYRYRKGQASELIQIPAGMMAEEAAARGRLAEVLADRDDALMEKLLEESKPTPEELYRDMRKDLASGAVVEVLLGSAEHAAGVRRLWKALRHDAPHAAETADRCAIDADGPPLAQIFKTVYAGHTGKLSYARVWRGAIKDGANLNGVRLGGIYRGDMSKIPEASVGDIVAFGRLEGIGTGIAVAVGTEAEPLPFPPAPPPVYGLAIATTDRKDDVKLSSALHRLAEEDQALAIVHDAETGETVLHGQGEIHLLSVVAHLAKAYGLKLETRPPRVAYKETIRKPVREHGRLKRQTGGHGQFADVKIEIAPRERGAGFLFVDKVVGGSVPRNFIPAVADAAEEAARKGPFGYPVVDIAVTLTDGGYHAVDSSDMAFKTATSMAMRDGLAAADPVLLEPVERVTVSVPNEYTARAQRLLSGRRGQILGFAERLGWPGWDNVEALVPAAESHDLIVELRSQTLGLGTFRKRFDHLAEARGAEAKTKAA